MQKTKRNLLVITNGFPDIRNNQYNCHFVYEYVNLVKDFFDNIYVISPQPYFPKLFRKLKMLNKHSRLSHFSDYKMDNIYIYYPLFFTAPIPYFRERNHIYFRKVIEKTIAKNKIDFSLIHAHFLMPTTPTAISLKKKYGKKIVLTLHGGDIYTWPNQKKKNLSIAKNILEEVDAITVLSECVKENIEKLSPLYLKKSVSINNFIDLNKFKIINKALCRKSLSLPQDKKILLNVSNLVRGKGHNDLIESIALLKDKTHDFQLYIIGEGEKEFEIKKKIKELDLEDFITIIGGVSNEKLLEWYCASDLFVFPSYQESFGIVQIEAMACGIPVVAYANEGSKEIIEKSNVGSLVPIGQINILAKSILSALNKAWDNENIRQYVANKYSSQIAKEKMIKLYKSLIETN